MPVENLYCPICNQTANISNEGDNKKIECDVCGGYKLSGSCLAKIETEISNAKKTLLSYYLRQANESGGKPFLTIQLLEQILQKTSFPQIPEQMDNLIIYLGRHTQLEKCIDLKSLT